MSAVTHREMYWWASGEAERARLRFATWQDDTSKTQLARAEAVMRLVGWCQDHAEEIREIAERDKAKAKRLSRDRAAAAQASAAGNPDAAGTNHATTAQGD
ncbi:hypothetical protein PQJ75_00860 [Rhodoplanes sp. TEM]|uniref:Uncharacterized protein n=1 Tax=Rhodoplanes tepidamans TaxID=200616 RepID=A0ABT5J5K2_RHOTP|nr:MULTISPECIES: hypothetical protein [Rhodoplanes]MDC7784803.1 hypothetical protein [Rhodoplanes tepidamans]MDC7982270.1 hypothetical protein [Rhodoplanes sp. TEM]MDQ0356277.1 hypothetical protein [Rhodoplanes tepidamans]